MMTGQDIRLEGQIGKIFAQMTSVVIDGSKGKEYRLPSEYEMQIATKAKGNTKNLSQNRKGLKGETLPVRT